MKWITFLLIFVLSSCAQIEKAKETAIIKDVVMSYNKGLINAAKTGNVDALKGMAADALVTKLYHWIAAWKDSDLYMDGKLEHIAFKNISISVQAASVLTSEDWVYEYKSIKTKQIVLPASGIYYEMEYILQKKDGKWMIMEINVKAERR